MANIIYAFVNNTIVADQEYEFYLCFDSIDNDDESQLLRCHLYDSQFFLEYYLPEIPLSSMQKLNCMNSLLVNKSTAQNLSGNIRTFKIKFPAQLAGGTFRLDFNMQAGGKDSMESAYKIFDIQSVNDFIAKVSNPNSQSLTGMTVYNNQISVDITIENSSGPSFTDLYWGKNEDISYGKKSPTRSNTTVYSDEPLYAHIHTEGMYGKYILIDFGNLTNRLATIKDNTLVVNFNAKYFYNTTKNAFWVKPHNLSSSMYYGADITPSLTYNQGNALNIDSPVTSAEIVQTGAKTEDGKLSKSTLCRVDFRPADNYDGSFGFSWYRVADTNTQNTGQINDWSFLENIGLHYQKYDQGVSEIVQQDINSTQGEFHKNDNMIKNHINDYQKILMPLMLKEGVNMESPEAISSGKYLVPKITIRKGKTAQLKMLVQCKEAPEKYCLEFSNPNAEKDGYLSLSEKDFTSLSTGKTIEIECKKEFSKSIDLNMYAYPKDSKVGLLCGSIQILPNDIMHQRNVDLLVLNVCFRTTGDAIKGKELTGIDIKQIQKFYDQAYLNLHVVEKEIYLNDSADPYVQDYYIQHYKWPMAEFNDLLISDVTDPCYNSIDYRKSKDLTNLFDRLISVIPLNNLNCYKIIIVPWQTINIAMVNNIIKHYQINGYSAAGDKRIIFCFKGCNDSTPTHELGHALGLPHTFTGCTSKAKYVYKYHSTDNFMDYSHQRQGFNPTNRLSFFHWQWNTMNALME